jgi:hypothetical protein
VFRSRRTKHFRALFDALPERAQRQASADYQLFKQNPRHPRLQFKQIGKRDPSIYSARAGDHYRAIGFLNGDTILPGSGLVPTRNTISSPGGYKLAEYIHPPGWSRDMIIWTSKP